MSAELIHDRGRGPEIVGTRITVYNLLPSLLDPTMTEVELAQINGLTPQQVAAARAYILTHPEVVLAEHLKIEDRLAVGNPPEVIEQAAQTREAFQRFRQWWQGQRHATNEAHSAEFLNQSARLPTFREWMSQQEPTSHEG